MSASTTCNPKVSLKLFIDKTRRKILFGEADKSFIDFLFSILALPIGTAVNLVTTEAMISGPFRNVYHSVQNLNADYFLHENHSKNALLKPNLYIPQSGISIFPIESPPPKQYFVCCSTKCYDCNYVSTKANVKCPRCILSTLNRSAEMVGEESNSSEKSGYMKDMISYLVMEDLTVKPMSVMSGVSMLANKLGVVDVGTIEEKVVYLDVKEGMDLLRAAFFCSSTVLSDVFLHEIHFESSTTVSDKEFASGDGISLAKKLAEEKGIKKEGSTPLEVFL